MTECRCGHEAHPNHLCANPACGCRINRPAKTGGEA